MKRSILTFVLILQSLIFAQEISFSKDSLYFALDNISYGDSIVIYNSGQSDLRIDSVKGEHIYLYGLEIIFQDSTASYYITFGAPAISFTLAPKDSAKLIFGEPDLCPICDDNTGVIFFTDTLTFYSNSIINPQYGLPVSGYGYDDVESENSIIANFKLYQNYPNPFNPSTNIGYSLSKPGYVNLSIYNILGKHIATLVDEYKSRGFHNELFNAENLATGIYIYKLNFNGKSIFRKMILLR